jgi:hypothetical protein
VGSWCYLFLAESRSQCKFISPFLDLSSFSKNIIIIFTLFIRTLLMRCFSQWYSKSLTGAHPDVGGCLFYLALFWDPAGSTNSWVGSFAQGDYQLSRWTGGLGLYQNFKYCTWISISMVPAFGELQMAVAKTTISHCSITPIGFCVSEVVVSDGEVWRFPICTTTSTRIHVFSISFHQSWVRREYEKVAVLWTMTGTSTRYAFIILLYYLLII